MVMVLLDLAGELFLDRFEQFNIKEIVDESCFVNVFFFCTLCITTI